ncbi:leucine zipper domain-containing protein [Hirsutella rhossiliensis]|uniref:Leucine zipper domain-containing protein n=1 Tax=Hirsutella rhossiliensis TaxID=111463 RepID=A0A9P8MRP9_9HYPO|nr:leucine zipper domain-containing protein [Hirsutella rhossiliensis]KAH0960182.1 leucine zipper domain-containing protein [Hirsutella rhossiliensis]
MPPSSSTELARPAHSPRRRQNTTPSPRVPVLGGSPARTPDGDDAAARRRRNTLAARKYRQRRLDRIAELERALGEVTGERDELRLRLARREAEVEALREMLAHR